MRYNIIAAIAFIGLFVFLTACDKQDITDEQQMKFIKYYGYSDDDMGADIIQLSDNSYALVGTINSSVQERDMCFIKTDKYGNSTESIKLFGARHNDEGVKIKEVPTGGYILLGTYENTVERDKDIYMVKLNSDGVAVWERTFGSTADDEAFDILALDEGGFIITGYSDSLEINSRDILIAKVSASGELEWFNLIGYSGVETGQCLMETNDGYLIVGTTNSRPVGTNVNNIIVVKTNKSGTGFLPKTFSSSGNTEGIHVEQVNSSYYILGTAYGADAVTSQFTILNIDNNLNLITENSFGEGTKCYAKKLIKKGDNLYIYGTTEFDINSQEITLINTTTSLSNFEYHYYGSTSLMQAAGISETSDGGFIMTGVNKINEKSSILLIKVDSGLIL